VALTPAVVTAVTAGLLLVLAGCEERGRAGAARPPTGPADRTAALAQPLSDGAAAVTPAGTLAGNLAGNGRGTRPATPQFHGRPLWAENRRGGAEENARYQFQHRGADIGARDLEDYLTRVHAFFDHPPGDAETATRASNGDRLIYSPGANLFGVQRQDGAPRLLMRPVTGRAYWEAQRNPPARPNMGDLATR